MAYEFDHVHLKAADPGAVAQWYVKAFNFKVVSDSVRMWGDRFIRCETPDGAAVNISGARTDEKMGDADASAHWGLEHFGIKVDDLDAEIDKLKEEIEAEVEEKASEIEADIRAEIEAIVDDIVADVEASVEGQVGGVADEVKVEVEAQVNTITAEVEAQLGSVTDELKAEIQLRFDELRVEIDDVKRLIEALR